MNEITTIDTQMAEAHNLPEVDGAELTLAPQSPEECIFVQTDDDIGTKEEKPIQAM